MNRNPTLLTICCAIALILSACGPARDGMEGHLDAVARAEGYSLSVDHAAELLAAADEELVQADTWVVEVLSGLWIGYTILATELASPDTFAGIDLTALTVSSTAQEIVWDLRQDVILAEAEKSDAELREAYEREQPYTLVQLRQILVRVPDTANDEEADSLRRLASEIRQRAVAGEDFAELAGMYSQDPGGASRGGSLGWVARGRLVPELEAVVFHMAANSISEPVKSPLGYHIVEVTGREAPEFDEISEEYRLEVTERWIGELERAYVDSLYAAADVRLTPGSVALVQRLPCDQRLKRLTPAERSAVLARYRGGVLTLGEWADYLIRRAPNSRRAFSSDSAKVAGFLRDGLVRDKLLVKAASDLGYVLPDVKADSIRDLALRDLFAASAVSGFKRQLLESGALSVQEAVDTVLVEVFTQRRSPAPLERVSPALRSGRSYQVYPSRFRAVVDRLLAIRERERAAGAEVGS